MKSISHFSLACALLISSGLAHAIEQTPSIDDVTGSVASSELNTAMPQATNMIKNASSLSKQFLSHLRFSTSDRSISFNNDGISKWSLVREKFGAVPGNPNSGTSAWMVKYRIYGDDGNSAPRSALKNAAYMYRSDMAIN